MLSLSKIRRYLNVYVGNTDKEKVTEFFSGFIRYICYIVSPLI